MHYTASNLPSKINIDKHSKFFIAFSTSSRTLSNISVDISASGRLVLQYALEQETRVVGINGSYHIKTYPHKSTNSC